MTWNLNLIQACWESNILNTFLLTITKWSIVKFWTENYIPFCLDMHGGPRMHLDKPSIHYLWDTQYPIIPRVAASSLSTIDHTPCTPFCSWKVFKIHEACWKLNCHILLIPKRMGKRTEWTFQIELLLLLNNQYSIKLLINPLEDKLITIKPYSNIPFL